MAKAQKLYEKSPSLKRNEDGDMEVHKPTEADGQDMGTEGSPLPGSDGKMPIEAHQAERKSMHKRHEEELKDMHDRHRKDLAEMHKRHESKSEDKKEEKKED